MCCRIMMSEVRLEIFGGSLSSDGSQVAGEW